MRCMWDRFITKNEYIVYKTYLFYPSIHNMRGKKTKIKWRKKNLMNLCAWIVGSIRVHNFLINRNKKKGLNKSNEHFHDKCEYWIKPASSRRRGKGNTGTMKMNRAVYARYILLQLFTAIRHTWQQYCNWKGITLHWKQQIKTHSIRTIRVYNNKCSEFYECI